MQQLTISLSKLFFVCVCTAALLIFCGVTNAAIMQITDIPVGKVISINGQKFTKVKNDVIKGSQFLALEKVNSLPANTQPTADCPMERIVGTMQTWDNCANLTTPTYGTTDYTDIGCLVDERDGKVYEVRKFADGKCWMVDNLMYGGGSGTSADYCTGKSTIRRADSAANSVAIATNGLNPTDGSRNTMVGDCRDPRVGCAVNSSNYITNCLCTSGSTTCGYFYNWPAAIQNANGWWNSSYQPTQPTQGICPQGWHLPTGNTTGEYQALHTAAGFTNDYSTSFWQPGGNWKGVFSGTCNTAGLSYQGNAGIYWSSTQSHARSTYSMSTTSSGAAATLPTAKSVGLPVRCIKN